MVPAPLSPGNLDSHFLCQNRQASADQTVNADAFAPPPESPRNDATPAGCEAIGLRYIACPPASGIKNDAQIRVGGESITQSPRRGE